jgi:hypothetical protein
MGPKAISDADGSGSARVGFPQSTDRSFFMVDTAAAIQSPGVDFPV